MVIRTARDGDVVVTADSAVQQQQHDAFFNNVLRTNQYIVICVNESYMYVCCTCIDQSIPE